MTDEGDKLLKTYDPMARCVDDCILASLPARQRDGFLQELTTIVQTLNRLAKKEASG